MQAPGSIDIVTLSVAVATTLFSPELAAIVGPYAVILFGATLGAAWAASREAHISRMQTLWYILGVVGWALIVTVPASELIDKHWGIESRWTLGPVAALIGGVGRDWPLVLKWVAATIMNRITKQQEQK